MSDDIKIPVGRNYVAVSVVSILITAGPFMYSKITQDKGQDDAILVLQQTQDRMEEHIEAMQKQVDKNKEWRLRQEGIKTFTDDDPPAKKKHNGD